jgi:diguanylate cyclase (GGDEF)-like protein
MKTVEQVMRQDIPAIGSDKTVADAVAILSDREINALPVVEEGRLVGVVTVRDLLRALPYRPLSEATSRAVVTASPGMLLTAAYTLMEHHRLGQLPVVDQDRLIGMITREDVLRELGQPIDPLTGLPWATTLRERAIQLLKDGEEIALLFLDLDNFGLINKQFGHVVGDQLIKAVAEALGGIVDSSKDLLCRYGGDEFTILTTRPRAEAEALGVRALQAVSEVRAPEGRGRFALSGSLGIAGGKRTTERHDVHFAATIDDLITMASLQSTQAKIEKSRTLPLQAEGRLLGPPRLRLYRVDLATEGLSATATVELGWGSHRYVGTVKGPNLGTVPLRLLAEATVQAVNQTLPTGWVTAVDEVRVVQSPPETVLVVTVLIGRQDAAPERHTGVAVAGADMASAAVKATLHALNRRIGQLHK